MEQHHDLRYAEAKTLHSNPEAAQRRNDWCIDNVKACQESKKAEKKRINAPRLKADSCMASNGFKLIPKTEVLQ